MKKFFQFMFVIMLIIPFAVSADTAEEREVVAETIKYFKTTTIFNNSGIMRNADMGEMTSLTTEITKEEFDNAEETTTAVVPLTADVEAMTETTYKRLTTTIEQSSTTYWYEANLYWKNIPKVRSYDIIGIGHYNDVELHDSQFIGFNMDYCRSANNCYSNASGTDVVTQYGTAVVFKLPTESIVSMEQTLTLRMSKAVSWTITEQVAAGDYSHATKTISQSTAVNAVGINSLGLALNGNIENQYYDTTPVARAVWTGSW